MVASPNRYQIDADDVFATLAAAGELLARSSDRVGLRKLSEVLPTLTGAEHDRVWAGVAARARSGEPAWRVGAAWLALPELRDMARRLTRESRPACSTERLPSAVLAAFMAAVDHAGTGQHDLFQRLLHHTYRSATPSTGRSGVALLGGPR